MAKTGRFWRNVVLIALAHVALIAGLIRWSLVAKASSNPESIVWLGGAGGLAAGESESEPSSPPKHARPPEAPKPSDEGEEYEKKLAVVTAKSEIELPSPTPKPTLSSAKASGESEEKKEKALAKNTSPSQSSSGKTGSTGKAGSAGGGSSASEFAWYGNMLHDRFYSAWIQPTTHVPTGAKISTLVKVRIEKDGHVSKFEIIKPSENAVVNESVAAVSKQVTEVDSPPAGLIKGDHYDVKINFELNTEEGAPK